MTPARRTLCVIAGLMLALLAVGLPLVFLEGESVTRTLVDRHADASEAGLAPERMLSIAEEVRVFVVRGEGELPDQVDGRDGFDASAVSHLRDVRRVLQATHIFTGLLALALAAWLAWALVGRRLSDVSEALKLASVMTLTVIALAALVALMDFDSFFSAFHGLFFEDGTWTFSYDSLLIQLFPEPVWATLGAAWAMLSGLMAACYWIAAVMLGRNAFASRA